MKEAVATLKLLCRQRTVLAWKQWRESIEQETKAPALQVSRTCLPVQRPALDGQAPPWAMGSAFRAAVMALWCVG